MARKHPPRSQGVRRRETDDEPIGMLHPDDGDPPCEECGQPLDPHEWEAGYRLCPQCEVLEREFRQFVRETLLDEQLPTPRD